MPGKEHGVVLAVTTVDARIQKTFWWSFSRFPLKARSKKIVFEIGKHMTEEAGKNAQS
jgi:hypothetical protein